MANIAAASCRRLLQRGSAGHHRRRRHERRHPARERIRPCKQLAIKPFGVNITDAPRRADEFAKIVVEEGGVRVVTASAGNIPAKICSHVEASPASRSFRGGGRRAGKASGAALGIDAVIAEGTESGIMWRNDHRGALVPLQVVDAVSVPFGCSGGGISDGCHWRLRWFWRACGVQVGTACLLASEE